MQRLWLIFVLAGFVGASPQWEPCKGQCITNYKRDELIQENLASACQKGCDLLTVSFISTSEQVPTRQETKINPKHSSTLILHLFGSNKPSHSIEVEKIQKVTTLSTESQKSSSPVPAPSKITKQDNKNDDKVKDNHAKSVKQDSSSKTTVEPTSQPVQDHPVEANRQTTTTNGPRRETKSIHKQKEEVIEVKQTNKDKHIQKHSPNAHYNKQVGNAKEVPGKDGFAKIQIHETIETSEHLNMKERLEQAKHTCCQECVATYPNAPEQEACVVGCNLQLTTLSLQSIDDTEDGLELPPQSLLGMFQRVIFNLAGHVGKLVRIGWSMFSSSQSNGVVEKPQVFVTEGVNRGQPMPQFPQMPFFISLRPSSLQEQVQKRIESIRAEQSNAIKLLNEEFFQKHQPFEDSLLFSHHNSYHSIPRIISVFKKESIAHHKPKPTNPTTVKPENQRKISRHYQLSKLDEDLINNLYITDFPPRTADNRDSKEQIQHQLDLLECISRKSGLPDGSLQSLSFTSAIVVLWLCFSLTAPPDDIKVVKTKPPELETLLEENDEFDHDELSCSEKKKLLAEVDDVIRVDDVIKINIQNV